MIITEKEIFSGQIKGVLQFNSLPILLGEHKGKFACHENALKEFPEIFESEKYEVVELDSSVFVMDEKEQLIREKAVIEEKIKAIEDKEIKPIVK
jgi:hypothetical protein